ncbi:MAG: tetratricopeptide repeat protein [Rhodopirellula sp.]|nr:tetratricopeptide repeat protein [Rhodopirellula sp.]
MPVRLLLVVFGLVLYQAGCQLPGWKRPVSRPLATSRQLCQQGLAAAERTDWLEAEKLFAKAVASCPDDPDSHCHYAEALWRRGERDAAVVQMLEAGELAPKDAALRVRIAEMQRDLGHWDLSLQSAQVALTLDPKSPGAWAVLARIKQARGMSREALADFQRSIQYNPTDGQVLFEIAALYLRLDQPQRALVTLQSLSDIYPPGEEPQHVLLLDGVICSALGRYDDAVARLTSARLRGRPTAEILYRLGEAELAAGRPDRAVSAAREAIALDPGHEPSRELLGRVDLAAQPGERRLR